jgi:hypothetical protein
VDDWQKYQQLVLWRLDQSQASLDELRIEMERMRTNLATLHVRSGVWGLLAGTIPVTIALAYIVMSGLLP